MITSTVEPYIGGVDRILRDTWDSQSLIQIYHFEDDQLCQCGIFWRESFECFEHLHFYLQVRMQGWPFGESGMYF